jgi:hypothetical protein
MKRLMMSVMMLAGAVFLASTAFAQNGDAAKELATARAHAKLAEASQSVEVAKMHLHHVINCLVGPHGDGFDAAAGNPCKGMGDGAEMDSHKGQMGSMKGMDKASHALELARQGVAASKLSEVHKAAAGVVKSIGGG